MKGIPQIGLGIDKTTVISSDEALFLEEAPKSLAIVGAGAVGMEFADIFSAFGSKVTVIEMLPRALPFDARSVVYKPNPGKTNKQQWLARLVQRRGEGIAVVALVNKNIRTAWAMLRTGEAYVAA